MIDALGKTLSKDEEIQELRKCIEELKKRSS